MPGGCDRPLCPGEREREQASKSERVRALPVPACVRSGGPSSLSSVRKKRESAAPFCPDKEDTARSQQLLGANVLVTA